MGQAVDASSLTHLQDRLGHAFADPDLLRLALTHSAPAGATNQRLEFLGDAILGAVLAEYFYQSQPDWNEGELSVARTTLVCRDSLAQIAAELDLGAHLIISREVARSGPVHAQAAVLADAVEAIIGAVFLDGSFSAARAVILHLLGGRLSQQRAVPPPKDAKTRLQEWLQARALALPEYRVCGTGGRTDTPPFTAECRLREPALEASAIGPSRKAAEQAAAVLVLQQIEQASLP